MSYKDDQRETRAALNPKVIAVGSQFKRENRRKRSIDRTFTKKGYNFGRKIGGKYDNLIHHLAKIQAEKK
jgi:hypothetical protein